MSFPDLSSGPLKILNWSENSSEKHQKIVPRLGMYFLSMWDHLTSYFTGKKNHIHVL